MLPRAKTLYIHLSLWVRIVRHSVWFIPSSHIPFWGNGEEIIWYPFWFLPRSSIPFWTRGVGILRHPIGIIPSSSSPLRGYRVEIVWYPVGLFRAVHNPCGLGYGVEVRNLLKKILKSIINSKKLYFERIIK